jgi:hypothetical protein
MKLFYPELGMEGVFSDDGQFQPEIKSLYYILVAKELRYYYGLWV